MTDSTAPQPAPTEDTPLLEQIDALDRRVDRLIAQAVRQRLPARRLGA